MKTEHKPENKAVGGPTQYLSSSSVNKVSCSVLLCNSLPLPEHLKSKPGWQNKDSSGEQQPAYTISHYQRICQSSEVFILLESKLGLVMLKPSSWIIPNIRNLFPQRLCFFGKKKKKNLGNQVSAVPPLLETLIWPLNVRWEIKRLLMLPIIARTM